MVGFRSVSHGEDTGPPSAAAMRIALAIFGVYLALGAALIPFATIPGPVIPGFIAVFVVGILITELSTALLLAIRFHHDRSWSLLLLGCAYAYSALMSVSQLVTFPGAILPSQALLNVSNQTAAWIFILWINGFALVTLVAVVLEAWFPEKRATAVNDTAIIIAAFGSVAAAVIGTLILASQGVDYLPSLISGQTFTWQGWLVRWPAIVAGVVAIAVIFLAIGRRSHLYLWLSFALTAMVFHNVLSGIGGARYTVGWTVGRASWIVSAFALFAYFLWQFAQQQRLMARTADLLDSHAKAYITDLNKSAAESEKNLDKALQRFLARENILRYQRMLQTQLDESHRPVISRLLGEEQAKLEALELESRS